MPQEVAMVIVALLNPQTSQVTAEHGPYPVDRMPWDSVRMWQTIATVVIRVLHDA
jgi:hypothetical protein